MCLNDTGKVEECFMDETKADKNLIEKAFEWAYDTAIDGISGVRGLESVEKLASEYLNASGSLEDKVNSLIRWQNTKCAVTGFLANIGGIIALPFSLPAELASIMYVQVRMVAAIAYMGGHDIKSDKVKTLVYITVLGNTVTNRFEGVGVKFGEKITKEGIKKIPASFVKNVNKVANFRLLTKFGSKGVINLGKYIPLVGGGLAALLNALATNAIGDTAKKTFITME